MRNLSLLIGLALAPAFALSPDDRLDDLPAGLDLPPSAVAVLAAMAADAPAETPIQTPIQTPIESQSRGVPILTVGNDAACNFTASVANNGLGLQQALDAAASDANGADETEIRLANSGTFNNRRYFISDSAGGDQTVTLIGGYASCSSGSPDTTTLISAGTATTGSLILIDDVATPQTVMLTNLLLSGGEATSGGGLAIENNNTVILTDTQVISNSATSGGGVHVLDLDDGDTTTLLALDGTRIRNNSADVYGGGVLCSGAGAQVVLDADVGIDLNSAVFAGGGLAARGGCRATSYASLPAGIYDNTAGNGGGIAAFEGSTVNVVGGEFAFLGFGDADLRTTVDTNQASSNGGGIWVSGAGSLVVSTDAWIVGNVADSDDSGNGDGGGVWVGNGARLEVDRTLGPDDCHQSIRCSSLSSNRAVEGGAVDARGDGTSIDIRQTWITANRAEDFGSAVYSGLATGETPPASVGVYLEGNMIVLNDLPGNSEALELRFGNDVDMVYNTFAGNADSEFDAAVSIGTSNQIAFFGNLVDETTGVIFSGAWNSPSAPNIGSAACIVAHEIGSLPPGSTSVAAADAMLDAAFRPTGVSPAVDFCDAATVPLLEPDLENLPRGVDTAGVTNGLGPYDLGALEFRGSVTIDGGQVAFIDSLVEMSEGDPPRTIVLSRTGAAQGEARIRIQTVADTATAGSDFTPIDTVLTWPDGDVVPKSVALTVLDDGLGEAAERLVLQLSIESGTATLGTPSTLPVTIYDNDEGLFADGFEGPGTL